MPESAAEGIKNTKPKKKTIQELKSEYDNLAARPTVLDRYLPDIKAITSSGVGYLTEPAFTKDNLFKRFTMLPGTHTPETCAMNAGLISANNKYNYEIDKINGIVSEHVGFFLEVYDGYFNDNVKYFDEHMPIYHSYSNPNNPVFSNGFANIADITYQYLNGSKQNNLYSIRLTGVFNFNKTGIWTFSTTSDDSSLLWIGVNAITGQKGNTNLNNESGHGMKTVVFKYECKNIGELPIKIVQGNGGGPSGLLIQYQAPGWDVYSNTAQYRGVTYIKCYTKDGKPYYPENVYYSLFGDTKTNTMSCGIYGDLPIRPDKKGYSMEQGLLNSTISSYDSDFIKTNMKDYVEVVAWEIINPDSKAFTPLSKVYVNATYNDYAPGILVMDTGNGSKMPLSYTNNNIYVSAAKGSNPNYANHMEPYMLSDTKNSLRDAQTQQYIANYPDLTNWLGSDGKKLDDGRYHFQIYGINEGRQISNKFKARINSDGTFCVYDEYNNAIWSLAEVPNTSDSYMNTAANVSRMDRDTFNNIVKDAMINLTWKAQSDAGASDTLNSGDFLTNGYNGNSGVPFLVDKSGKFKIQISDTGNLVLLITKPITSKKTTLNNKDYLYTTYDDNLAYLYKADAPAVTGKTFSLEVDENGNKPTYYRVDTKSKFMAYDSKDPMVYTEYKKYFPTSTDTTRDSQLSSKDCAMRCSTDEKCMYYYSYKKDGTDYCQLSTGNNHLTFATSTEPSLNNSSLFIKNPDILFNELLGDPNSDILKLSNRTIPKENISISNAPYIQNGKSMISDLKYVSYLNDVQYSLYDMMPNNQFESSSTDSNIKGSNSAETTNSVVASKSGGSTDKPASQVKRIASTNVDSPQYSDKLGESFINRSSTIEGMNTNDKMYLPNLFFDSVPKDIKQSDYITQPGMPSKLVNIEKVKYGLPDPETFLQADLALHCMVPPESKLPTTINTVINYYGNNSLTTPDAYYDNTTVPYFKFNNKNHVDFCYDWGSAYNCNRDNFLDVLKPTYVSLSNGYMPPSTQGKNPLGITISCWVCLEYNKCYSRIIDFGDEFGGDGHNMIIATYDQWLIFCMGNGGYTWSGVWVGYGCNANDWHHIVWTISTDGQWHIYLNGSQANFTYAASAGWNKTVTDNNLAGGGATYPDPNRKFDRCFIGRSNWWWDGHLVGKMSDFRIYNGALRPEIVGLMYNKSYKNYNTNPYYKSVTRGIYKLCFFDLRSKWHWINDDAYDTFYAFSRSSDGVTTDIGWKGFKICMGTTDKPTRPVDYNEIYKNTLIKDDTIGYGYSLKLDGKKYIDLGELTLPQNGMTVSLWIKLVPGVNNCGNTCWWKNQDTWRRIFDFGNGPGRDNFVLGLRDDSLALWVDKGKGGNYIGPDWYGALRTMADRNNPTPNIKKIADNKWHHFAWVIPPPSVNGDVVWQIYLDGVAMAPIGPGNTCYPSPNKLTKCYIGASNWGSGDKIQDGLLKGNLSDFRIYSNAFIPRSGETVADEVALLYNMNKPNEGFTQRGSSIEGFSLLGKNHFTNLQEGYTQTTPHFTPSSNPNYKNTVNTYPDIKNNTYSLDQSVTKYNSKYGESLNKYIDMSNNINGYIDLSNALQSDKYGYSSSTVDVLDNKTANSKDVLRDDVHELILYENTVYSLGVITCATLLIAALFISSKR